MKLFAAEGPTIVATISIVCHGHVEMLVNLLNDLMQQECIEQFQVIVTFNISRDCINVAAFNGLNLKIIHNSVPKGFGANHNAAFEFAVGQWFLIVNPDIRLPDQSALNRLCSSNYNAALIAPVVIDGTGEFEDSVRVNLTPWSLLRRHFPIESKEVRPSQLISRGCPFFWFAGMFLVVDADAYRNICGFDERYFLYCEDYDLCLRLYLNGYSLAYSNNVRVVHLARRASRRKIHYLAWHLRSLIKVWTSKAFWELALLGRPRENEQ